MFDHARKISSIQDDAAKPMLWAPRASVSGCRLSLDRQRPVPTDDQGSKPTIYVVPHISDTIECWSGEDWVPRRVPYDLYGTQSRKVLSLDITGCAASTVYDVFVRNVSDNWQIIYQPWNSVASRCVSLSLDATPDGLGIFQGRLVRLFTTAGSTEKTSTLYPDWLYLGTFYTTSGQNRFVNDTAQLRLLYNVYNQVSRPFKRMESTSTWTYGTSTWRQANASSSNQVECVTGLAQFAFTHVLVTAYDSGADSCVGIGVDSSTPHADCFLHYGSTNYGIGHVSTLRHAALGYRTYRWCELRVSAGTVSFYGTTAYGGNNYSQCGMSGEVFA